MHSGELYVKKIPSIQITDLAQAIAPNLRLKEVGIRPGEKLHKQMITKEDARNTLEFKDYFVILPEVDVEVRSIYNNCKRVAEDFEYNSENNTWRLSINNIRKLIEEIE